MRLVVLPTSAGRPVAKVVEALEEALALAKTGKIVAVGIAMVEPDHATATSMYTAYPSSSLIAAISILQHRACHEHAYSGDERPWFPPGGLDDAS